MKLIDQIILPLYFKNLNNRIYTLESAIIIEKTIEEIKKNNHWDYCLGGISSESEFPQDKTYMRFPKVSHKIISVEIKDMFTLTGTIETLENHLGKFLEANISNFVFRPLGCGICDKDGYVRNFKFIAIEAVSSHIDSFKNIFTKGIEK